MHVLRPAKRMTAGRGSGRRRVSFDSMWADLAGVGRDARSGGYRRFAWTDVDLDPARVVRRRGRSAAAWT